MSSLVRRYEQMILNKASHVQFVDKTDSMIIYYVDKYTITYDRKKHSYRCGCEHGVMWGVNKPDERCRHLKSLMKRIEYEKGMVWSNDEKPNLVMWDAKKKREEREKAIYGEAAQ